jgi:hypothetical protein
VWSVRCAAVCGVRSVCAVCGALIHAVCGSACSSVRLSGSVRGSVWQCVAVCGSAAVCGCLAVQQCAAVRHCASFQINSKYMRLNWHIFGINQIIRN